MRGHVNQRAAAAELGILAPSALDLRIPAGQLGSHVDDFAQLPFGDQFPNLLMRAVELHHVAFLENDTVLAAEFDGLFGFGRREGQRLFAKDVLAGFRGLRDLARMAPDGRGDVNGFDLRIGQQLGFGRVRLLDAKLRGDLLDVLDVHDRHKPAVVGLEHAGDRAARGNAAGSDDAEFHWIVAHGSSPYRGVFNDQRTLQMAKLLRKKLL